MTIYQRGSEWRKWDLHVHTPCSILNNQFPRLSSGQPDWEPYLARLEGLDVAVIGATDYFTIAGYKELRQFRAEGRLANIAAIFPNIEFRLSNVVSSKKDSNPRRLNFHVIFSDEVSPQDIEEHFLHDITFFYEGHPQADDETRKLKTSNLEELGRRLIAEHAPFKATGKSALEVGAMTAVVNHEQVTEILRKDSRFRGKHILVYPEEGFTLIDWDGQDHLIRKGLLQKADMVFSPNPNTIQWCLGEPPYAEGPRAYRDEFKSLKPCIHGSDARNLKQVGLPCARRGDAGHSCGEASSPCDLRYCWLKADPTFEGLKQLLYEPAERVAIQAGSPAPVKGNHTIRQLAIDPVIVNAELSITETAIELNEGLVAVTGGRGSGKTAFVDLIANSYVDRCNSNDANSFARRISTDGNRVRTKLTFRDGSSFGKTLTDGTFFDESEIVYIAQAELERYIGSGSDLTDYINELVFDSPLVRNSVTAFDFAGTDEILRSLEAEVDAQHDIVAQLEQATTPELEAQILRDGRQARAALKDAQTQVDVLARRLTEEKRELSAARQKALTELQAQRDRLQNLRRLIEAARDFVDTALPRFAATLSQINQLGRQAGLGESLVAPSYADDGKIRTLLDTVDQRLRDTVKRAEEAQAELRALEAGVQEHAKALTRKQELEARIAKLTDDWRALARQRTELGEARKKTSELFGQLLQMTLTKRDRYDAVIALLSTAKRKILADLEFRAVLQFDGAALIGSAGDVVDNRQVEVVGTEKVPSVFSHLLVLYESLASTGEPTYVEPLVLETARLAGELRDKLKRARGITATALYRSLYSLYLSVAPSVLYKRTRLDRLSLGQKATVLLKIYLAQGTAPIVIDSHDEHLDNEFIMEELVDAIREAKQYRQVILASNNGNMVINSDAEQIVVAQRQDTGICYTAGSIENPVVRELALKVLEGGVDAFRSRQAKYGIQN